MLSDHNPRIRTFPRRIEAESAVVGIDLQLEQLAPLASMPWVNSLRVSVGESDDDEKLLVDPQVAYSDQSELFTPMVDDGQRRAVLVGLVATPGSVEWFVYSSEPCADALAEAIDEQFDDLEVEGDAREDPEWSVFCEFLKPSTLERQLIENRVRIHELREIDDDLDRTRPVNHTFWFTSTDDRNAFAEQVAEEGFDLHYPEADQELPGEADEEDIAYGLTISRVDQIEIDAMDMLVKRLFKEAASYGGEYEGWYV